jgi:hypothetical protein
MWEKILKTRPNIQNFAVSVFNYHCVHSGHIHSRARYLYIEADDINIAKIHVNHLHCRKDKRVERSIIKKKRNMIRNYHDITFFYVYHLASLFKTWFYNVMFFFLLIFWIDFILVNIKFPDYNLFKNPCIGFYIIVMVRNL